MSRRNEMDNRANQMNPNNDVYWESRGYDGRPNDWRNRVAEEVERDRLQQRQRQPAGRK